MPVAKHTGVVIPSEARNLKIVPFADSSLALGVTTAGVVPASSRSARSVNESRWQR